MKRGGIWLITMAAASLLLPLVGIRFEWSEMFGGNRVVAAILVIMVGIVLYAIADAREQNLAFGRCEEGTEMRVANAATRFMGGRR